MSKRVHPLKVGERKGPREYSKTYRNTIPVIILKDSLTGSVIYRILVGLPGLVGLHGPCQQKQQVLTVLSGRSHDQLINFWESFWTNGDFETADYICAAEMFGSR